MRRVRFTLIAMCAAATVLVPVTAWASSAESRATTTDEIANLRSCRAVAKAYDEAWGEYNHYKAMRPYRGAEERYALARVQAASNRAAQLTCTELDLNSTSH